MIEIQLKPIIATMSELIEDNTVPKNVKVKLGELIQVLEDKLEMSLKINKALQELEDISDDSNLQSFNRIQIWNLISSLESV